jgi:hypothetical protein
LAHIKVVLVPWLFGARGRRKSNKD